MQLEQLWSRWATLSLLAVLFSGCQQGLATYADGSTEKSPKWVQAAGGEARHGQRRELSNDPLNLREVFMSEKARDIERNLGFD